MGVKDWSITASDNGTAGTADGINASEGIQPGQLNDNDRAIMAEIKEWYNSFQLINAVGGTETDLGTSDGVRLSVSFTANLPRVFLTAKMQIENTATANTVWLTLELTDSTGSTVLASVGQPFSAAASNAATGDGFLALPVNVTAGTSYQARIKLRKDVAAGPIYPRRMTISGFTI